MDRVDWDKRLSFTWNIIFNCNYRCHYCWTHGKWQRMNRNNRVFTPKEIINAWRNILERYGSVEINILGGEPFLYPNFIKIIKVISNFHSVNISTNLSLDIEKFVEEILPLRVKTMPTFHPSFADADTFINKLLVLRNHGFDGGASLLAYPPHLKLWEYYKQKFKSATLGLGLIPFWGRYKNINYPQGYTTSEQKMIKLSKGDGGREGLFQLKPKRIKKGTFCRAGQIYAEIESDGSVKRCDMDPMEGSLGNFFDGSFKFLDKPMPCDTEHCPCNLWTFLLVEEDKSKDLTTSGKHKSTRSTTSIEGQYPSVAIEKYYTRHKFYRLPSLHKVYWNWEITYRCNYQCSYCKFWKIEENQNYIKIKKLIRIWENIFNKYGCCHIRFSGGEPTIYPNFFELLAELSQMHTIDITTNLNFNIDNLIRRVNPEPLTISPSFHPEFDNIHDFLEKAVKLRQHGFQVSGISYVAYSPHLNNLKAIMEITERNNMEFKIIPFHGTFQGRTFPNEYSDTEKRLLKDAAEASINKELNFQWLSWCVDKVDFNSNGKSSRNTPRLCRMGQLYARITPEGVVTRCCIPEKGDNKIGNIFDDDFKLLNEPALCWIENCPCFKAMIAGKEKYWLQFWGTPRHHIYKI